MNLMLIKLKEITGSLTKALDLIYVLEGIKPVSRLMFDGNAVLIKFLKESNLHYELSDFKILKHTDKSRNFSDKGIRVGKEGDGIYFMYVSRNKVTAKKAKMLEEENNHIEFGKILGYPVCCCSFFEKNFSEASEGTNDLTVHTFRESNGFTFPWQNNNCLRGFDISLISYFPCRFDCLESKKQAEKNFSVLKKYDTDTAKYFENALKSAVIYSEGVGVYNFHNAKMTGRTLAYVPGKIISGNMNEFYNVLRKRNRITVFNKSSFLVGEVKVEDDQTFFGLFS